MKKCSKCEEWKPLAEFYQRSRNPDGYSYYCKACDCAAVRAAYQKHKEKYNARSRDKYHGLIQKPHKCTKRCVKRFGFCIKARNARRWAEYKKHGSPVLCKSGREVPQASFVR